MIREDAARDAAYRVDVARDRMSAMLTVTPPYGGGAAADAVEAEAALKNAGVVFGIDAAAVADAVAAPGNPVVVARGELPQAPVHARLETLIDVNQALRPKEDESGRADFRELGILRFVAAGTPLMRRYPPQAGVPGHNVMGAELVALKAKDVRLPLGLQGAQPSPQDPDLLIAAIDGQPVQRRDGISVEPVLVVDGVNLSTGNIDFPGTVEVKGDVESGMKIKAGSDIIIHGTLESADIEAGGEVQVKGGIIGQLASMQATEGEAKPNGAVVRARGNVHAHHIDNATIYSDQSVLADESIRHSEVVAMEQVIVGKQGSRKGHIIGGGIRATRGVAAYSLGSTGSSKTRITVGVNPELEAAIDEQKIAVDAKLKEQEDLEKIIKVLQARPGREDLLAKAKLTFEKKATELADLLAQLDELEAQLKLSETAEVVVKAEVHPGTMVTIGHKLHIVSDDLGAGVFRLVTLDNAGREEREVIFST
jgi:uncharacterized protein (DUF342 family)